MTSTINLRILSALSICASTEETRYYLKGVKLEITPRHTTYVVTDGHRLVAHREELHADLEDNATLGDFIIPLAQCKAIKLGKHGDGAATISGDASRLTIEHDGSATSFKPIDGSFPDWRRVIPSGEPDGVTAQFNPKYLADFAKIGTVLGYDAKVWVAHNGDAPASVSWNGNTATLAVIMPIRLGRDVVFRPAWLDASSIGAAAAMLDAAE